MRASNILTVLAAFAGTWCLSNHAAANDFFFGWYGNATVALCNDSTNEIFFIEAGTQLDADATVGLTAGPDTFKMANGTGSYCGSWLFLPATMAAGVELTVNASTGNDHLLGGTTGTFILNGEGQDDRIRLRGPGTASGGAGDDEITSTSSSSEILLGGDGADCLEDESDVWGTFDCGPGDFDEFVDATGDEANCDEREVLAGTCLEPVVP